jgi:hypothetical protein
MQEISQLIVRMAVDNPGLRIPAHGGHDSDLMPDSVPASWRTAFRFEGGHFLARSGMLSAMIPERLGQ